MSTAPKETLISLSWSSDMTAPIGSQSCARPIVTWLIQINGALLIRVNADHFLGKTPMVGLWTVG